MEQSTPEEHSFLLHEKIDELVQQQQELQHRMQKLRNHLNAIDTLNELKSHPFTEVDIDTDCIVSFDLGEIKRDNILRIRICILVYSIQNIFSQSFED